MVAENPKLEKALLKALKEKYNKQITKGVLLLTKLKKYAQIDNRKKVKMTLNEMKSRYKELLKLAEGDVMTAGEFDELMALYKKINNL